MRKIVIKNPQNSDDDLLYKKIKFISDMFFSGFSPTEISIMKQLVSIGENGMLNLTIDISKSIRKALSINDNTLNVCISRIESKGAIRKNARVIVFQPIWNNIINENEYLICFNKYEKTTD